MTKSDAIELTSLLSLVIFVSSVLLSVFLVKRANPDRRAQWFFGCAIVLLLLFGIIKGPIAILASLATLALLKKENSNPLSDIGNGFLGILAVSFGFLSMVVWGFAGLGGIYWLWLAIQLKSFGMFFLGMVPFFWIVTAPVGAYAWAFGTPQWVTNTFS
jgi:hypothetical protein